MRVIRTELYFSGSHLKRSGGRSRLKLANVSFAWLKDVAAEALGEMPVTQRWIPERVPLVIDHILREGPLTTASLEGSRILNEPMVYEVMRSEIVIEQSPPDWETLANILRTGIKGGGTVLVSLAVGLKGDPLLFIAVPSAMLLIALAGP